MVLDSLRLRFIKVVILLGGRARESLHLTNVVLTRWILSASRERTYGWVGQIAVIGGKRDGDLMLRKAFLCW